MSKAETEAQVPIKETPEIIFTLKPIVRDTNGLIEGINYVFNEEGRINWRKMVKGEFLVPNKQFTEETDISKLEDNQLIILLGGLKWLAQIRGYTSVEYRPVAAKAEYFATVCRITWLPNYETEGRPIVFESQAGASQANTSGFTMDYLAEIAENRAFARCIRNFLKINIVSREELKDTTSTSSSDSSIPVQSKQTSPITMLQNLMQKKGLGFEKVKARLIKDKVKGAETFTSVEDIPAAKIFELIERVNSYSSKS